MKKMSFVLLLCLLTTIMVTAQDNDTIEYKHGLPETGEDTAQAVPQDFDPKDSFVEISVEQLPQELYRRLNDGPQFEGWRDHVLLFDKNTGQYLLRMKDTDGLLRTYTFNAQGDIVSLQEVETE